MSIAPVRVQGLAELRKSLRAARPELAVELRTAEVEAAQVIAVGAAQRAPRGTRPLPKNRRRRLHEVIRVLVRGTKVYVGATAASAPHASVNHWGGTITPRGRPIRFPPRHFVLEEFDARREQFIGLLADGIERVFRRF
jgi:hypothetical protein